MFNRLLALAVGVAVSMGQAAALDIKSSPTPGNTPALQSPGEIGINRADGRLFYRNEAGAVSGGLLPDLDASGYLKFRNGMTLGRYQGGKFVSTPDSILLGSGSPFGAGVAWPGAGLTLGNNLGLGGRLVNPTVQGWGISFNSPTATGYSNGAHLLVEVDGSATNPTNGLLVNSIVRPGYCATIGGVSCATPVFVGTNFETQVQGGSGTDYWGLLGVLDVQPDGSRTADGGQATSGIIRGNWSGTRGLAGLRSQAENYSGRAAYGLIIGASMSGNLGQFFDNAYSYGAMVHAAKDYGFVVGGLEGGNPARLPTSPFALVNANSTETLWSIANNNGTSATQSLKGDMNVSGTGSFGLLSTPQISFTNGGITNSGSNLIFQQGGGNFLSLIGGVAGQGSLSLIAQPGGLPPYFTTPGDFSVRSTSGGTLDVNFPVVGTAGGGTISPPSGALGFVRIKVGGTFRKLPYYPD